MCVEADAPTLSSPTRRRNPTRKEDSMRYAVLIGRVLYSAIFVLSAFTLFSPETTATARQTGVPLAHLAVPLAGVMAAAGGLSVLLGYRARIGAALVALFLIGVTPTLHAFWAVTDPATRQI